MNHKPTIIIAAFVAFLLAVPAVADYLRDADYLDDFEKAVLREHNLLRTDPKGYARYVEEWLQYYRGRNRRLPGRMPVRTEEGRYAVREAIEFLRDSEPVPPLRPSRGLSLAARDHVKDTGPLGWLGHEGTEGDRPGDRANRYGEWFGRVGENITYGGYDAREFIIRLLIDDGVENRGHRLNLLNADYRLAGVSFGRHREYGSMCVITYAADYDER